MQATPNWFKNAVVYSLDVRSFKDGNQDGRGDLKGLLERFDYLLQLGITCIWLSPICASQGRDDGYDVVDYYEIDPALGDFDDFQQLVERAKANDVKLLLDLVINHTSVDHPWFKRATEQPDSIYHDYYIWQKEKPENDKEDLVFKTVETSNWEYQPAVDAFFYHTFYKHQADLNVANPRVQEEILAIIDFWMSKGINGFRLDAVPHILRNKGSSQFDGDPDALLGIWDNAIKKYDDQAILIGEADVEPEEYPSFIEAGKLTGLFNFFINNYSFLSFATQRAVPMYEALGRLPLPDNRQYLNFLRNHDELDLERLTEKERQLVFDHFAPEPSMIIYDRGIRRRLPPMVENNVQRVKLSMSLLLSLPGTPVIRYGEEIGMGDDLNLPERRSVRTAMQWLDSQNAGFSDAAPHVVRYPIIRNGPFSYYRINVADGVAHADSLLNEVKKMISIRSTENRLFQEGRFTTLKTDNEAVLAFSYELDQHQLVILHNFKKTTENAEVATPATDQMGVSVLFGNALISTANKQLKTVLPGYTGCWLLLAGDN
ncbi:MAG TPA: alpha-amylase family glycosyl hydrolase [Parapedobacter sp.]|nr:alpha-amylase family glycosyl hydrolase [Parapedobacter sp.]